MALTRPVSPPCSTQREPLGQGYVRGHHMPEGMGTDTAFGMKVDVKVRRVSPGPAASKG